MKNSILITAVGSFSADIVIKNTKKMGFNIIGCDIYPKEWIADAFNVNKFFRVPYATNEKEYITFIKNICEDENVKYIIPLTDVEVDVFNKYRKEFTQMGVTVCISSNSTLEICRNKKKLSEFINANYCSINTIQTVNYKNIDKLKDLFPLIGKPSNGRSSQGLKHFENQAELQNFIENAECNDYIFQPFISGSIITVDVVRSEFTKQCYACARKELLRTLNGAGTSVYIFSDERLTSQCCELADLLNISGCVNFEFIQNENGNYYFLECNPRFSGGVEFTCIAGYDCISNHINAFCDKPLDDFRLLHNCYIARKYEEYTTHIE